MKQAPAPQMSAVKFTSDYGRNESHKTELCSQLMFRSSRCIPKADGMGIMQVTLITLLGYGKYLFLCTPKEG